MCCLVIVGHNGMAMQLTRNDCEEFLEVDEADDDML